MIRYKNDDYPGVFMVDSARVLYTMLDHLIEMVVELGKLPFSEQIAQGYKIMAVTDTIVLVRNKYVSLDDPALYDIDRKIMECGAKANQFFGEILKKLKG